MFPRTKDTPRRRRVACELDERLEALQTDYIDLIFIHAVGDRTPTFRSSGRQARSSRKPPRRSESRARRNSSGSRLTTPGAESCRQPERRVRRRDHAPEQPVERQGRSDGPGLDACHKAGIGLVSMKQVAGNVNLAFVGEESSRPEGEGPDSLSRPVARDLDRRAVSRHAASRCGIPSRFGERRSVRRSTSRSTAAEMKRFREIYRRRRRRRCAAAATAAVALPAGTSAELGNLTRYLTYHEHHGDRREARRLYAEMPEAARDWTGADLEAAPAGLPSKLDFASALAESRSSSRLKPQEDRFIRSLTRRPAPHRRRPAVPFGVRPRAPPMARGSPSRFFWHSCLRHRVPNRCGD